MGAVRKEQNHESRSTTIRDRSAFSDRDPCRDPICNLDQHAALERQSLTEGMRQLATEVVLQGIRCQAENDELANNQNHNEHS